MWKLSLVSIYVFVAACHSGHVPAKTDPPLTEAAIAVPIAPGKTEAWQQALHDLTGPRYAEYESSRRRFGLTSQTTFLQRTPMGDFALIHMTGPDVHASFHAMSTSQDSWDVKWREMTMDLHGVDFAKGERVIPKVVPLYSTDGAAETSANQFMFLAPLGPGGGDRLRELATEIAGARHVDYVRARASIGVRREAVFLESTSMGDAVVVYWLADDPKASLQRLAASTDPFDVWLRDNAKQLHPLPLDTITAIASANTLVGQYPAVQPVGLQEITRESGSRR
jgi:hypothetical protein